MMECRLLSLHGNTTCCSTPNSRCQNNSPGTHVGEDRVRVSPLKQSSQKHNGGLASSGYALHQCQHLSRHPRSSPVLSAAYDLQEFQSSPELHRRRRRDCECHDMFQDLVAYVDGWEWQKLRVEDKVRGLAVDEDVNDTLIILQHPSVYTLGTRSSEAFLKFDVKNPPFELHRTERGGEVTYHGPGQLVMYPIIDLRHHALDLHWYLRSLEEVVIGALDKSCGIHARRIDGLTGVWVGDQKVAAIGVRVSRWITYHGLALNVTTELAPFSNIIPCGISDYSVTSVAKLLNEGIGSFGEAGPLDNQGLLQRVHDYLLSEFEERFKVQLVAPKQPGPKNMLLQSSTPELVSRVESHML